MKKILCILALLVLSASTADAYVRRTIGGGYVARGAGAFSGRYAGGYYGRGFYGRPLVRGAAVAAGAAAVAATGWGYGQPYYGGDYYGDDGTGGYYGAYAAAPVYQAEDYYGAYAAVPAYPVGYGPVGYYGAYAATGYPGYYGGGYAYRSYITGRPTLFPRYYGW